MDCFPPVRLVALDLDGTLLTDEKNISPQTLAAVNGLCDRHVKVVLASARPPRGVRHLYRQLQLDTLQINYNGALVWDERGRRPVVHTPLPGELVGRLITAARGCMDHLIVASEILDSWHTDRHDTTHTTETGRLFQPDVIAALETFSTIDTTKLMFLADPPDIDRLVQFLAQLFSNQVTLIRTDPNLVQLTHPAASKAVALRYVADQYGIPMRQTLAVGDAENDVGMVQAAGVGVAMGNATAAVKAVADWVAPDNNHHGVAAAIEKFIARPIARGSVD